MRKLIFLELLALIILPMHPVFSQTKGVTVSSESVRENAFPKSTFALIIGISSYQNFPSLQFADKDANAFYNFLTSEAGGKVNPQNVRIILNEKARAGDIWRDISWLTRVAAGKGDRAYIYFSGHGDAANEEEAYLLAYDAPNEGDPNLYNVGGTFQIYNLKSKIRQMTARGVEVILITDACRTNELPGKENGAQWTFNKIMEKQSGEIQMTSCAANEKSSENQKWGNGRGVFSWYLINGLYGLADDDPADGKVSLYEIENYVKKNVRKDTRTPSGSSLQNPVFCCGEKENTCMSIVNENEKSNVIASQKMRSNTLLATETGRTIFTSDPNLKQCYASFRQAVDSHHFFNDGDKSALHLYNQLISSVSVTTAQKDELKIEFSAELINHGQEVVNNYINGGKSRNISKSTFEMGSKLFETAIQTLGESSDKTKELKCNLSILQARAIYSGYNEQYQFGHGSYYNQNDKYTILQSIVAKLDSISVNTNNLNSAVLFHTYSLTYSDLGKYDTALTYALRAANAAPKWDIAYSSLGLIFRYLKKFELSEKNYLKALELNPREPHIMNNLAVLYFESMHNNVKAETYFQLSIEYDSLNPLYYYNLSNVYGKQNKMPQAITALQQVIRLDSSYISAYNLLGGIYLESRQYELAEKYFLLSVYNNKNFIEPYLNLGEVYMKLHKPEKTFDIYAEAYKIDSTHSGVNDAIGNYWLGKKEYLKAIESYNRAMLDNRKSAVVKELKITDSYNLACCYSILNQKDDAMKSLEEALKLGFYNEKGIAGNKDLINIQSTKEYILLMKKYFPKKKD